MDCHEALMARRRKKTARNTAQRQKLASSNSSHLDKSLPSLPPSEARKHAFSPPVDSPSPDSYASSLVEAPTLNKQIEEMRKAPTAERRDVPSGAQNHNRGMHVIETQEIIS